MDLMGVINAAITFCILFVFFNFLRLLILPHLKVGVFSLSPSPFWLMVWSYINRVLLIILVVILIIMYNLWILWHVIRKFVPNIFGIRKLLLSFPPFPQLTKARIFALFDAIANIFNIKGPFIDRFLNLGTEIGNFIAANTELALRVSGMKDGVEEIKRLSREEASGGGAEIQPKRNGNEPPPKIFDKSEQHYVDDYYQQCMEENTIPITADASEADKRELQVRNMTTSTICKIKKFQALVNQLSYKI